jgi:hypothetical protein
VENEHGKRRGEGRDRNNLNTGETIHLGLLIYVMR